MTREKSILVLDSLSTWLGYKRPITEEIVEAIKILSQPSLPSNLDEAAKEYGRNTFINECMKYGVCDDHDLSDAFKAGAEWMAGQGHTVDGTFHHSCGYPSVIELKTYLRDYEGADVIVQIRKKQ